MTAKFDIRDLSVSFHGKPVIRHISLQVAANGILGIIGPASSGKTTFLRVLNRMNELEQGSSVTGQVLMDGNDIYRSEVDAVALRKSVGMVFALPVPLPMSIHDNVVYGPTLAGISDRGRLTELTEKSLKAAFLWEEVKDRLNTSGLRLSGGQQQRLCLARVLAMEPGVILLDEPCSGLDPISTAKIEDALTELKRQYTIVLVTNNTKQAARISDETAFFLMGELIEMGPTNQMFTAPRQKRTNDYITGRFG
jgi:phosphate transport system ATP-binding protein